MVRPSRHWCWLGREPHLNHRDYTKRPTPRYDDQHPADFRIAATARYSDYVSGLREGRKPYLSLANLAVQVIPTPVLSHETAYFMQAIGAAINFIARYEFNNGVIRIVTFVAFND